MTTKRARSGPVYFLLGRFFGFGVNGAGGDVSNRLSASSASFSAAPSTEGSASSGFGVGRLFIVEVYVNNFQGWMKALRKRPRPPSTAPRFCSSAQLHAGPAAFSLSSPSAKSVVRLIRSQAAYQYQPCSTDTSSTPQSVRKSNQRWQAAWRDYDSSLVKALSFPQAIHEYIACLIPTAAKCASGRLPVLRSWLLPQWSQ